jgi:hypothetical protein
MLEGLQILLCLQETFLEVQEAILEEEERHDLHPPNRQDLSKELEEACMRVDGINGEHAAKGGRLSQLLMRISNALVDLDMLPIQDVPQFPKSARDVLMVAGLILERLQDVQASDNGLWN